jgi:anti-anti-sigma factor
MLELNAELIGNINVLRVKGPVDSATFEEFREFLGKYCQQKDGTVLLDCSGLTYMNSKALGLLSSYHRTMLAGMGRLALCNLNRKLVKTMDLLGLGQMLKMYDSCEEALKDMK